MDGIAVDGVGIDLFVVVEDAVSPEGTGTDNVTVGKDVTFSKNKKGQRKDNSLSRESERYS